ncbi:MAG: HEAT repeat domain-containing protein [Phycisphaeraceae bacterium]|nr:HEAT repeat domain-containing protein [Phycisphaeraceae bacterium]
MPCHAGPLRPTLGGLIDLPHLADPKLELAKPYKVFDPRLEPLWLKALGQNDPSLQRQVLYVFADAHEQGMEVSADACAAIAVMLDERHPLDVRLTAARALHALDHRAAADAIAELEALPLNATVQPVVDVVLADWDYEAARPLWRQRVTDSVAPSEVRVSAIEALGRVADPEAREPLLKVLREVRESAQLRLAAAAALGRCAHEGLVDEAAALSSQDELGALLAVRMIDGHAQPEAIGLVNVLTRHESPAVAAAAARRLLAIAPLQLDRTLLQHDDPDVRLSVTRAVTLDPSLDSVTLLAGMLDDPSVSVRSEARDTLIEWGKQESLRPAVLQQIKSVWAGTGWRGREQAALIANWIDHKPMADTLAQALDDARPEVRLGVCAALRRLQVTSTAPAMIQRLDKIAIKLPEDAARDVAQQAAQTLSDEGTQLFVALGIMNAREAEPIFRRVVPKHAIPSAEARVAAIWALGHWYANQPEPALIEQFTARLLDESIMDPESPDVQVACAVAMGRMQAKDQLETLRQMADNSLAVGGPIVNAACHWAVREMTGEPIPPLEDFPLRMRGWFLEPVD